MRKRIEIFFLVAVIFTAAFLRFWHIRDYVVFLGDEGRDMIVMRNVFKEGKIPFLGPSASVGGFYLGPIYYWMAAPFLWLWNYDPVGPAYFVAILGVLTVVILYRFLRETSGYWPAILASFLYATAPLILRYSRSSWNPNPLPLFSLILMYSMYLGLKTNKVFFFIIAGAAFGISLQLHYLASLLAIVVILIVLINARLRDLPKISFLGILGFLITFSPFLIFEIKHSFPNFRTISEFVTRGTNLGIDLGGYFWSIYILGNILLEDMIQLKGTIITRIAFWLLTLGLVFGLFKNWKNREKKLSYSLGLVWFLGGLGGLRLYTGQVFDYYFGLIFVAPFLATGLVFNLFWKYRIAKVLIIIFTISCAFFFLSKGFFRNSPNRLINQTTQVSDFVIEKTEGKAFNFALISDHNSDHAYRYFLEIKEHKPVELETMVTDQLLIVCEATECKPLGHPLWEIAGFGRGEVVGEWELPDIGIRVIKLRHWPGVPSPAGQGAVKGG